MVKPVNRSGSAQPVNPIGKKELVNSEANMQAALPLTGGNPVSRENVLGNAKKINSQYTAKHLRTLAECVQDSNGIIPQGGSITSIGRVAQERALKYIRELFTDVAEHQ